MTLEQALLAAVVALSGTVGVLFKLLLSERQARLTFVESKLTQTEAREETHKVMLQALIDMAKAQGQGALPSAPAPTDYRTAPPETRPPTRSGGGFR